MKRFLSVAAFLLSVSKLPGEPPKETLLNSQAREPGASLAEMTTHPELEIQLAAAEPLTADPVDFAWGPDGRLWVVEMTDYPLGIDGKGTSGGRVRVLTDGNGDWTYDESTLFLDGLNYPTGVMPWRDGVLVVAAPDLLFARDTDGDDRADVKEVLLTGFSEGNQQHRVNGLRWGLDGWLYLANGDSGGVVKSAKSGQEVNIGRYDLRFRPDDGKIEAATGPTQHGRNRNDAGDWFGCNNSNPLWHCVLPEDRLRRNPHFAPPNPKSNVPEIGGNSPVYPTSVLLERFNDFHTANRITSACASNFYRDTWLGDQYEGNVFVCEPVHNLVHREVMRREGATYKSRRADNEKTSEFLTSKDPWFRPVSVHTGPDGALWVADMYRLVIEHPEWIPHDWETRLDLRAGHDKGRIYRILRHQATPHDFSDLTSLSSPELVKRLGAESGTTRDLVHQLLLWNGVSDEGKKALREMTQNHRSWKTRLQALACADALGALDSNLLSKTQFDKHWAVRRLVLEIMGRRGQTPEYDTPPADTSERLALAFALGDLPGEGRALADLALADADNPFVRAAALSGMTRDPDNFVGVLLESAQLGKTVPLLEGVSDTLVGLEREDQVLKVCHVICNAKPDAKLLHLLAESLTKRLGEEARQQLLAENHRLFESTIPALAASARTDSDIRRAALAIHMAAGGKQATELLGLALASNSPLLLQRDAIRLLAGYPDGFVAYLKDNWPRLEPTLRQVAVESLRRRSGLAKTFVGKLKTPVAPEFRTLAESLCSHPDPGVNSAARDRFGILHTNNVEIDLDAYRAAFGKKRDLIRGRELFTTHCALCHRAGELGKAVGPDLASLSDRTNNSMLVAIVDPNAALEDKYGAYTVTTHGGEVFQGLLEGEVGGALRLRLANGEEQSVLRRDCKDVVATGMSLMPEGFGAALDPSAMNDLIGFVQSIRTPRKKFRFNEPKIVVPGPGGELRLSATTASVHGPSLTHEQRYLNLGNWSHPGDLAAWVVENVAPGEYEVRLDFSCDDSVAGNRFRIEAADNHFSGKVPGTGNWNGFREERFGTMTMGEDVGEIVIRSEGTINRFVMDLRTIILKRVDEQ